MMSVRYVAACLWLGVLSTMTTGQVTPATTSGPCAGNNMMEELQAMKQMLTSIQQAQSPYSVVGSGSSMGFIMNKLLTLEVELKATQAEQKATQAATQAELKTTKTKLEATETALQSRPKIESGSTFVRWGRKTCTNSSQVVYTGVAGGSWYDYYGAAVDLLCLTLTPQFETTPRRGGAYMYGAEYGYITNRQNHDVPCSVCRAAQSTTIMIPATHACPLGWTTQYTGHLVAGYPTHKAATQYNCLDGDPESDASGHETKYGNLLYYTVAKCGSLPCPPYINDKVVLCVVCSK